MIPNRWKETARQLNRDITAIYWAARHPRTPWWAKVWILVVVAFAVSPIDLIPDFIPVLGYLDDVILIPLGVYIAIKLIPVEVMVESRALASQNQALWLKWVGLSMVVSFWLGLSVVVAVNIW
jgi:uncharacterized membrane protein YkvA (DUF1232 family)